MNAVALVESLEHVCVRYRLAAFQAGLARAGHTLALLPFEPTIFRRIRQYQSLHQYDAVILQRTLLSSFELSFLRRNCQRLLYDFDDAVWQRDSYDRRGPFSQKRLSRFQNVMAQADAVVAGNEFLADTARRFTRQAVVVPSCVAVPSMVRGPRTTHELTLVWIGSSSTLQSLEALRPTFEAIGRRFPNVRLKVICDKFPTFDPLLVQTVRWSAATEAEEIASADVGLAVMPDDDWSRGKCGVKVLQYLAAGLPVIANPVGVHLHMVRPTETGFLAATTDDWLTAIQLLHDARLRERLGDGGRTLVNDRYSLACGEAAWFDLLAPLESRIAC